ncbi:MAG: MaoC family dehydratase N-terminal domain-containing protein [Deltaproteobacteria bacterium]|nr:MaoC family dehydratase N-terminal domain-containing protein [Deltaproteobacteria bacterium]
MRYFEDYPLGCVFEHDERYLISEDEIMEVGRRWDPQPFHIDPDLARNTPFGGLVASSVLLFAVAISLGNRVKEKERPAAVSALGFNNMQMHSPARPGDELSLRSTVIESRLSNSHPNLGVVNCRNEISNQKNELVFVYEGAAFIKRRA